MAPASGFHVVGEFDADGDGEVEFADVAAGRSGAFAYRVEEDVGGLREERVADPSVGELAGEPKVHGSERRDVDGDVGGRHQGADAAPLAVGQGQLVDDAVVLEPLAGGDASDDLDGLAGALDGLVESDAVPTFHHLGTAGADPEHESSTRQRLQRERGHREHGWSARPELHDARREANRARLSSQEAERCERVARPELRDPYRVDTELVRLPNELDSVGSVRHRRNAKAQRHGGCSASCLIPSSVARMLPSNSSKRRAMMRSSLSGMAVMAMVRPDGAGPMRAL